MVNYLKYSTQTTIHKKECVKSSLLSEGIPKDIMPHFTGTTRELARAILPLLTWRINRVSCEERAQQFTYSGLLSA